MMLNMRTALAWKALPTTQAIGAAVGGKGAANELTAALFGTEPDTKAQIEAAFESANQGSRQWRSH